ncbi:glycosyl hydrolase family 8 [Candidatus Margulisiibacteriota bacterium]
MAQDWLMPYPNPGTYPFSGNFGARLQDTWAGYKARYITAHSTGLVHDPSQADKPETADFDETAWAVSEGQGYGMLLALYHNDQACFDGILDALYTRMYNKRGQGLFAWQVDSTGKTRSIAEGCTVDENGSATDGDIFIGLALAFADKMVQSGHWSDTGKNYGTKAQSVINNIYAYDIYSGRYVKGGNMWADGYDRTNPSYFFTAAMKIFDSYESTQHDWTTVIDQCYTTIQSVNPGGSDGYFYGLNPDWCTRGGGISAGANSGPSLNGYDHWYDAARVPWMMAVDAIWFNDPRAVTYCQNGTNFLKLTHGGESGAANNAILYNMNGTPYGAAQGAYHNVMTVGMWGAGAVGSGDTNMQAAFTVEYNQYSVFTTSGYWGDWAGAGSIYYNQSLGSFGALVMGGNFVNVYADLGGVITTPTPTPEPTPIPTAVTPSDQLTKPDLPARSELTKNFPNPFTDGTSILYQLKVDEGLADVKIIIHSMDGRKLRTVDLGQQYSGKNKVATWDGMTDTGNKLKKGVYLYTLEVGGKRIGTKKMMKID